MGYLDFRDQVVVVTGASSGIGAAAAVGFAETGATVADAAAEGDVDAMSRASVELGKVIRSAACNSVLAALSANLEKRARFYFEMVTSRHGADWVSMDNTLVELIAAGDSEQAGAKARQHILETGTDAAKLLSDETA